MRPSSVPRWLAQATDEELHTAQHTFWAGCAKQFAGQRSILAFNLINEPELPTAATSALSLGCVPERGTPFGARCSKEGTMCYCANLWRKPSASCDADCRASNVRSW